MSVLILEPIVEQSGLLGCEPSSEIIISTVRQPTDKVTDVVVLISSIEVFEFHLHESLGEFVIASLDIQIVLLAVAIDLFGHKFLIMFFVLVVQELDLFQYLKAGDCDVLELENTNHILGWLIIKTDDLGLSVQLSLVFGVVLVDFATLAIFELLLIDNHR
jgi:hypothetical protein